MRSRFTSGGGDAGTKAHCSQCCAVPWCEVSAKAYLGCVLGILVSSEDAEAIAALEDCEGRADGRGALRTGCLVACATARKRFGLQRLGR
jgi:hypothetical protein